MGANRQPVLGYIDCPVCEFPEMQVKHDKNGDASAYCPDCSQQLFTRNPHKSGLLIKRMRPVAAGAAAPVDKSPAAPDPVPVPVFLPKPAPEPAATPAPAAQAGAQGANGGADKETTVPAKKTAPAAVTPAAGGRGKAPAPWFAGLTPIMARGKEKHVAG